MAWKPGTSVNANVDGGYTGKISQTPPQNPQDVAIDTDQETPNGDNYIECDPQDVTRR